MLRVGETSYGGRAYFATSDIPASTVLLREVPCIATTLDDFKREVCVSCFHYDCGRTLKVRVGASSRACTVSCATTTPLLRNGVQAMLDQSHKVKNQVPDVYLDLLRFCIAAVPLRQDGAAWAEFLALQDDRRAFTAVEHESARGVVKAMKILYPDSEMDLEEFVGDVAGRMKCNAFGIWEQREDGTSFGESEMLGFAMYIKASYFNHSCLPNVEKSRCERVMEFRTLRDVLGGEELVISYLGDREYKDTIARREALRGWGFNCICALCTRTELHP